jgi:hypothetical protein
MDWVVEESRLDIWHMQEIFLFSTASRSALGVTQPSIQWVKVIKKVKGKAIPATGCGGP